MFGWRPHEFWRATPAELSTIVAAMCHPQAGVAPPDANMLKQLMEAFPDG
ncbi:MAG: phage tail assembly chaperone [Sphingomonas sp.]